jgi:methylenetetrahydrofolate dehydrogenase (NADP+)/methenyltetrahydrofolate cyclohydrolase
MMQLIQIKAINWLLAGYAIDLKDKKIAIVGNGRLVGAPLARIWKESGYDIEVLSRSTEDIASILRQSNVIVTATGVPHLITSEMIAIGSVVVDAGTASEEGRIVGDIDEALRSRDDLTITPEKGGVGPLTVAGLFDNVITAAQVTAKK